MVPIPGSSWTERRSGHTVARVRPNKSLDGAPRRMKRPSPSTRTVVGLLLLGVLGAAIFWHVWPVATAISVPDVLRPLSEAHPRFILVCINLLYLGTATVSLLPAALVWMLNVGERRVTTADRIAARRRLLRLSGVRFRFPHCTTSVGWQQDSVGGYWALHNVGCRAPSNNAFEPSRDTFCPARRRRAGRVCACGAHLLPVRGRSTPALGRTICAG